MPKAHNVLSYVTTYTWPVPADKPAVAPLANDVIVLPLFQISLPVSGFSAYSTAGDVRLPPESANTTPFTMIGARGEIISRDTHSRASGGAPAPVLILNAV